MVISRCTKFQGFPKSIGCLRDLKILVLNGFENKMRSLPEGFCHLQSLEHLTLSGCRELSSLPSSFGDLRNLRHLDLSHCNKLSSLPDFLKKLTLLQHLCLEGCSKLALESDILENMAKVEYLNLHSCEQLEELPSHITNQDSLRNLDLCDTSIREIPINISQLSKMREFYVGSELLTSLPTSLGDLPSLTTLQIGPCSELESLPTSLGDLSSLTDLTINGCSKLEFLPDSVGRLNLLETLIIVGSGLKSLPISLTSSLCNLKQITLDKTQVFKISISEDCCPSLETLQLRDNEHLTEIEVLPTTVKPLYLSWCKMVSNISGIVGLINIQTLCIDRCPKLDVLPNFSQLASLQCFELKRCYGVKKIQGLEHCRALETLRANTRWEEAGTENFERMERLRWLKLRAISRSAVEGCIPSMQKWPEDITVCTRAVPVSGSLIDSFAFTNLSVIDSISNQTINSYPTLKLSSNAHCILLCLLLNCNSPKYNFFIAGTRNAIISNPEVEGGKWVLICIFTQRSRWHTTKKFTLRGSGYGISDVERGMVVVGEEERVVESFRRLWALLSN